MNIIFNISKVTGDTRATDRRAWIRNSRSNKFNLIHVNVRNGIPLTTDLNPFVFDEPLLLLHFTYKHTIYLSCSGSESTPSPIPPLIDHFPFELVSRIVLPQTQFRPFGKDTYSQRCLFETHPVIYCQPC